MKNTKAEIHGNHFDNVKSNDLQLAWIGGIDQLKAAQKLMKKLEPGLPSCPFCGAPTVLEGRWAYNKPAVQAVCTRCRCSSQLQVAGTNIFTREEISLSDCILRAANLWTRRAS